MTAKKNVRTATTTANVKAAIVPVEIMIDKGIPIPQIVSGRGKYPLEDMLPGDSFLVMCAGANADKLKMSIMGAARRVAKKLNMTFVALVRPEEKGVRCWRSDAGAQTVDVPPETVTPATPAEHFVSGEEEAPAAVNTAPVLKVFDE